MSPTLIHSLRWFRPTVFGSSYTVCCLVTWFVGCREALCFLEVRCTSCTCSGQQFWCVFDGVSECCFTVFPTCVTLSEHRGTEARCPRRHVGADLAPSEYIDRAVLPRDIQGYANALVVGVIYCNGFGGRCREWSILTKDHFLNQMRRHRDYVVCSTHKTSLVYGDLAKWLAPGTIQAMLQYLQLPRRDDVETFLHPVATDTAFVDVHLALKMFAVKMMPAQRRCLSANLLRRWYHTRLALEHPVLEELARLGTNRGVDAVRDSFLRDPLDDVFLAKILVEGVIGSCVPWPEPHEIPSQAAIPRGFDPTLRDTDVASEDEELEWFHGSERYGIPDPRPPVQIVANAEAHTEEMAPTQVFVPVDGFVPGLAQTQDSTLRDTPALLDTVQMRETRTETEEPPTQPQTAHVEATHARTQPGRERSRSPPPTTAPAEAVASSSVLQPSTWSAQRGS